MDAAGLNPTLRSVGTRGRIRRCLVETGTAASDIYITRIDFENFRTFGKFGLDLPAAPGLTLLVGTNGLGKSSFFDGLEWALTGSIRRFTNHLTSSIKEGDYLTRRDAPADSHQVILGFSTGTSIFRSATNKPSQSTVIELLKRPEWGAKIEDIATYLAFTHFLGQTAQQRFTSLKRNEQWEALKGPSGIDRLEEVRGALRGAPTRNAFRKRLQEQQGEVQRIESALSTWREMTARLQQLRQTADAAGDVSGALLDNRISALVERLRMFWKDIKLPTEGSPSQRLIVVREEITRLLAEVARKQSALQGLNGLAARYVQIQALVDPKSGTLAAARTAVEAAGSEVTSAEKESRLAQDRVRDGTTKISELESEIARLSSARDAFDKIAALELEQTTLSADLSTVEQDLATRRNELSEADTALERDNQRRADLETLGSASIAAKSFVARARELERLEKDYQAKMSESAAAETAATEARKRSPSLRENSDRLRAAVEGSEHKVAEARHRASEMAGAVALIASHLGEHDQTCPVCATAFGPGILKEIADKAASAQNFELAAVEREHAGLVAQANEVMRELAAMTTHIGVADSAAAAAAAAREQVTAFRDDLAVSLGVDEGADLSAVAARQESDAAANLATLIAALDADASAVAAARVIKAEAAVEIDRLGRRHLELIHVRADVAAALRSLREGLAASGNDATTASLLTATLAERNGAAVAARERLAELEKESASAMTVEAGARQRSASAEAELVRVTATLDAAIHDAALLRAQWSHAGLDGEPADSALEIARADLARQSGDLTLLLDEQTALAAANEGALRRKDLADFVQSMESQAGLGATDDPSVHERLLQTQLDTAKAALDLTESTHAAVNALSDQLKKEAEDFSTQFLVPLNDLIDDYNKALLTTPGESILFNAAHNVDRTRFDMRLRYKDPLDEALYNTDIPPHLVLSEGQLAANGFSILCAASTAYPWSKWRALLLDDPLQHNDVIHAAAFVDVMRNLVELQGYQLIMSSHDRAEGAFIARKFDAAGLPCTVVALTAPSKDGVRFEPPRHNSAARALLDDRLALSG
jgi:DNA repair exonuclease SbcCD ATPase subunit